MPRKGRGGAVAPTPGRRYGNRTDLQLATGMPYGEKAKLTQAIPPQGGRPNPAPANPTPQPAAQADPMADAAAWQPRPVTPLAAPTTTPGEHVMAPPPPAIQPLSPSANSAMSTRDFLTQLAQRPGVPSDILTLAGIAGRQV